MATYMSLFGTHALPLSAQRFLGPFQWRPKSDGEVGKEQSIEYILFLTEPFKISKGACWVLNGVNMVTRILLD